MQLTAVIQAGGRSTRMGEDKAWLSLAGQPLIERVLAAAQPVAAQLAVVINAANPLAARYEQLAAQWQARLLYDHHEHLGPLGGLHTALTHFDAVFNLPCDLPFLTAEFLAFLHGVYVAEQAAVTVPLDRSDRRQMTVGLYAQACRRPLESMLAAGELKADRLCRRVPTRAVVFAEYAHLTGAERFLLNLNTPEDYFSASTFVRF